MNLIQDELEAGFASGGVGRAGVENVKKKETGLFLEAEEQSITKKKVLGKTAVSGTELSKMTRQMIERVRERHSKKSQIVSSSKPVRTQFLNADNFQSTHSFDVFTQLVEEIDNLVNLALIRKNPLQWNDLKTSLYRSVGRSISILTLQKMIAIIPLYKLIWLNEPGSLSQELAIIFNENGNSECSEKVISRTTTRTRKELLREKLIETLIDIPESQIQVNGGWTLTENWQSHLPVKPLPPSSQSSNSNHNNSYSSKTLRQRIEDNTLKSSSSSLLTTLREKGLISPKKMTSISASARVEESAKKVESLKALIMERLKEKEQNLEKENKLLKETTRKTEKTELIELAESIKFYYEFRKVNNMFLIKVIEYLSNNFKKIKSTFEIGRMIDQLCKLVPTWIYLVENKAGKILRVNNTPSLQRVKEIILN